MNEDNKYKLKDYMLDRPPLTPERVKELAALTCYVGDLTEEELKSPVVLRSEYEDLLSLAKDMYQSLDSHCGDPVTAAYKLRMGKHDG